MTNINPGVRVRCPDNRIGYVQRVIGDMAEINSGTWHWPRWWQVDTLTPTQIQWVSGMDTGLFGPPQPLALEEIDDDIPY